MLAWTLTNGGLVAGILSTSAGSSVTSTQSNVYMAFLLYSVAGRVHVVLGASSTATAGVLTLVCNRSRRDPLPRLDILFDRLGVCAIGGVHAGLVGSSLMVATTGPSLVNKDTLYRKTCFPGKYCSRQDCSRTQLRTRCTLAMNSKYHEKHNDKLSRMNCTRFVQLGNDLLRIPFFTRSCRHVRQLQ